MQQNPSNCIQHLFDEICHCMIYGPNQTDTAIKLNSLEPSEF
jgi:hypothetical protein